MLSTACRRFRRRNMSTMGPLANHPCSRCGRGGEGAHAPAAATGTIRPVMSPEQTSGLGRPISEDLFGAGPSVGGEDFQDCPFTFEPSAFGRCLDHGVLATDLIGRHRYRRGL